MHSLYNYLIVFLGAGLRGALRHAVNVIVPRLLSSQYPYSTFIVNVGGSLVMGLIAGWFAYKGGATINRDGGCSSRLVSLAASPRFQHFHWRSHYYGNAANLGTPGFTLWHP